MAAAKAIETTHHPRDHPRQLCASRLVVRAERPSWIDSSDEQHLIGDQIADTSDHRLIEQHRLGRRRTVRHRVESQP